MFENGRISARQFLILVFLYSIGSTILVAPSSLAADAKQSAWIAVLIGIGVGSLLIWLYVTVAAQAYPLTLVEWSERVLGKWLGKAISLWFLLTSLEGMIFMLGFLGNFLTTQIMPETPAQAINMTFLVIAIMGLRLGLETMARTAELLFVPFVVLFVIFLLLVLPQTHAEHLKPLLEVGVKPMIRSVLMFISLASLTLIVMTMVYPACAESRKQAKNAFLLGHLGGGLFMFLLVLVTILVLGVEETTRKIYPSYVLAERINIGDIISRVEVVMALLWFITLYFKLTFYFYAVVVGLSQTFGLREYRALTYPLGIIALVMTGVISPTAIYERIYIEKTWLFYIGTSGLLWPLLLLCVAPFRKKALKKSQAR